MTTQNYETAYRWVITTLVGLLCFSVGVTFQSERVTGRVSAVEVKVDTLERSITDINHKLDLILTRTTLANPDRVGN